MFKVHAIMPVYRWAILSCVNKGTRISDPSSGVHELLVLSACKVRPQARDSDTHVPQSTKSQPSDEPHVLCGACTPPRSLSRGLFKCRTHF